MVIACFLAAVFCWGFGLYGHGIYLTELQRLHGWSTSLISGAVTGFYLLTAACVVFISDAISRGLAPSSSCSAACCVSEARWRFSPLIDAPWQLYLAYMLMAVGAATMHVGAISNVVGLWFDRKRPLAISLALNGASSGGILVAPALVLAIRTSAFPPRFSARCCWWWRSCCPRSRCGSTGLPARGASPTATAAAAGWTRATALRSRKFWSVAAPFAMALTAQVGFLVHQIAIVEPSLGRAQAGLSVRPA